jgi:DUF4097 and DUF4098 domain-containing protein YvlB
MAQNDTEQTFERTEVFHCDGPAELDLRMGTGRLELRAVDSPGIRVRVAIEPAAARGWEQGLESALGRVSAGQYKPSDADLHALREMQISFSEERSRLVIRAPRTFKRTGLAFTIDVPKDSRVAARIHRGSATVSGTLAGLNAATGSGNIRAERIQGSVDVATGSGDIRLGRVTGRVRSRSGSGEIEIASIEGDGAKLTTGNGDVWLGVVRSDVQVRTGNGGLVVAEAAGGRIDLVTGSGDVSVSIRPGIAAEIDLASGSGQARSDLAVATAAPAQTPLLRIRARTGSGDAVVTSAPA